MSCFEEVQQRGESCTSRLQTYRVIREIGKGSYGQVFLVTCGEKKKQYVMKNIKLTSTSAKERLGAEQEAALLSSLHHPNIVSYKESFQDKNSVLHIVMGYCEGGDLCSRLKTYKDSHLEESQVVEWFIQIALALQYLHERNILHRDLKTQNIFLSKNDIIKVGDLGIARVLDGSCDLAHTVVGTPYYMSPELFANQPYNHKSDIWALGCCVYEMASLKHAFSARNINALMYKIVQGNVPPIPSQYSRELMELVQLMMARNAEERPSVHQILCRPFVRSHIKTFLDRASTRRRKGALQTKGEVVLQPHQQNALDAHLIESHSAAPTKRMQENVVSAGQRTPEVMGMLHTKQQIKQNQTASQSELDDSKQEEAMSSQSPHPLIGHPQKIPRPLPPDPNCGMSSARQRRRKSKQLESQEKGVLRAHSSSNEKRDKGLLNSQPYNLKDSSVKQSDSIDAPVECDSSSLQCDLSAVECDPSSDEVDQFYTLLDSTLHLPESDPTSAAVLDTDIKEKKPLLPSGRLADRIKALRLECESVLGVDLVQQVTKLLTRSDPEEAEDDLKMLLGRDYFESYAAKLQQLKLCEDSLFSH